MIALGLGVHKLSASTVTGRFRAICTSGFKNKTLTKSKYVGWLARYFRGSIYKSDIFEEALKSAYGSVELFGLRNETHQRPQHLARVAVTTTVDTECRLLTNYRWGDDKTYLGSHCRTWGT